GTSLLFDLNGADHVAFEALSFVGTTYGGSTLVHARGGATGTVVRRCVFDHQPTGNGGAPGPLFLAEGARLHGTVVEQSAFAGWATGIELRSNSNEFTRDVRIESNT